MKVLTRERVVPTISASVSWLILAITGSGFPSLPKLAISKSTLARRFSLELKRLIDQVLLDACIPRQDVCHEDFCELRLVAERAHHICFIDPHDDAIGHR